MSRRQCGVDPCDLVEGMCGCKGRCFSVKEGVWMMAKGRRVDRDKRSAAFVCVCMCMHVYMAWGVGSREGNGIGLCGGACLLRTTGIRFCLQGTSVV